MRKPKPSGQKKRSHERTGNSYNRRAGNKTPGKYILIVCEGAETEPNYFKDLRQEIKAYFRKHIPGYDENMHVFAKIKDQTAIAIQRSKTILRRPDYSETRFPNPSTGVHLLVEEMIGMSPSGREHFIEPVES